MDSIRQRVHISSILSYLALSKSNMCSLHIYSRLTLHMLESAFPVSALPHDLPPFSLITAFPLRADFTRRDGNKEKMFQFNKFPTNRSSYPRQSPPSKSCQRRLRKKERGGRQTAPTTTTTRTTTAPTTRSS